MHTFCCLGAYGLARSAATCADLAQSVIASAGLILEPLACCLFIYSGTLQVILLTEVCDD